MIGAGESAGGSPLMKPGNSASVWCVCVQVGSLLSRPHTRERGLCKQEQEAKELKAFSLLTAVHSKVPWLGPTTLSCIAQEQ